MNKIRRLKFHFYSLSILASKLFFILLLFPLAWKHHYLGFWPLYGLKKSYLKALEAPKTKSREESWFFCVHWSFLVSIFLCNSTLLKAEKQIWSGCWGLQIYFEFSKVFYEENLVRSLIFLLLLLTLFVNKKYMPLPMSHGITASPFTQ